jgi:Flp pilus assembly pilin Flp
VQTRALPAVRAVPRRQPAPPRADAAPSPPPLLRDRRGATALEFALVAVPLTFLVMGLLKVALQLTSAVALDFGMLRASRFGSTGASGVSGAPPCRAAAIPWFVTQASGGFLKLQNLRLTAASHDSYADLDAGLPGTPGAGGSAARSSATP